MRFVVWNEPGLCGKVIVKRVPVEAAVQRQRAKGHYDSDQEALLDFLAENLAWVEEAK